MAKERLSMKKLKEILRLKYECGLSNRKIARSIHASHSTVREYLRKAEKNGFTWPIPEEWDDHKLQKIFGAEERLKTTGQRKTLPDLMWITKEMRRKGVTLQLLWEEYRESHPEGYGYSRFCSLYEAYQKKRDYVLRQDYKGGEKLFVDFAGQTVPIHNALTGSIREAQIFVGCLGASNYTYSEAVWTQGIKDWITCHIHAYEEMQGVAHVTIPDNLKSGVSKACRYDPDLNPTYRCMAEHYGTAIIPARAGKPKDKAKVESAVLVVERWILAALRHRKFYSLEELNQAIRELTHKLNHRPFKKLPGCRYELFKEADLPMLKHLPEKRYEYAEWKIATVHVDYHVEVEGHRYSVPYELIGKKVDIRITYHTVEIFCMGSRIASHRKNEKKGGFSTQEEHRPKSHREYLKWNPERFIRWAEKIGPCCAQVIHEVMNMKQYPELGFRTCLGILRLSKSYTEARLESACKRAVCFRLFTYRSIEAILKSKKDLCPILPEPATVPLRHENVRGQSYYQVEEPVSC